MSRLPNYRKNSLQGLQDMLNNLHRQQNRSQFSPRILASDGEGGMTRDQAIGNDALAGALVPWSGAVEADPFTVAVAWGTIATLTIPVPVGFTRALATTLASQATAMNGSTQSDYLFVRAHTSADSASPDVYRLGSAAVPPGEYGYTADIKTGLYIGLEESFAFDLQVSTQSENWGSANVGNAATLSVSLLFLR